MDYAAPAAAPATPTAETIEEGRAPPTIDSHGGKLTPVTGWYGPDSATSTLMLLALLATVAPRGLKIWGRFLDLSAIQLAPGLLLAAIIAWNRLPSLSADSELSQRFPLYISGALLLGLALFLIAFLHLLADALMPIQGHSRTRSLAAMIASGLAILALPVVGGFDIFSLMDTQTRRFDLTVIVAGYAGIPVGIGLLLLWRRFDGRLFGWLLVGTAFASYLLVATVLEGNVYGYMLLQLVAFSVAAALGAGLRGLGRPGWKALTGRAAWIWSWILRICLFTALVAHTTY